MCPYLQIVVFLAPADRNSRVGGRNWGVKRTGNRGTVPRVLVPGFDDAETVMHSVFILDMVGMSPHREGIRLIHVQRQWCWGGLRLLFTARREGSVRKESVFFYLDPQKIFWQLYTKFMYCTYTVSGCWRGFFLRFP